MWQGHCILEFTVSVTEYTRSVQNQASQCSSMDAGGLMKSHTAEEPLVTDGC